MTMKSVHSFYCRRGNILSFDSHDTTTVECDCCCNTFGLPALTLSSRYIKDRESMQRRVT